mgnify:CR=1 FL=1
MIRMLLMSVRLGILFCSSGVRKGNLLDFDSTKLTPRESLFESCNLIDRLVLGVDTEHLNSARITDLIDQPAFFQQL